MLNIIICFPGKISVKTKHTSIFFLVIHNNYVRFSNSLYSALKTFFLYKLNTGKNKRVISPSCPSQYVNEYTALRMKTVHIQKDLNHKGHKLSYQSTRHPKLIAHL